MKPKNRDEAWRKHRMQIRKRYMDLTLYPDEYTGTEEERIQELITLQTQISKFRYRSIRNFIHEVFEDASNGIVDGDVTKSILKYLRGYRDKIEWEHIAKGHQLTVNGQASPWVATNIPAEVGGYMAFYKSPHQCRIVRIFDVRKYKVVQ